MIIDELVTLLGLKLDPKAQREAGLLKAALGGIVKVAIGVGTALAAAAAAVQAYAFKQAEGIAESKRFADSIDVSFERLQELSYATRISGGSADELRADLEKLTKSMSSPIPGEYNQTLYMLGISARDASGKMRGADEVLLSIADKLQGMDKQRQLQFADRLGLSQSSLRLIQQGRAGIEQLSKEARSLGVVLDKETGDRALRLHRSLERVRATVDAVGAAVTSGLLPAMEKGAEALTKWLGANRELIASGIRQVIEGVGQGFRMAGDAVAWLWSRVEKLVGPIGEFNKTLDLTRVIAIAVAAALASVAVAVVAATWPVLAITAAIAALVLVVEDLYTWFTGGESIIGGWVEQFTAAYPELAKFAGILFDLVAGVGKLLGGKLLNDIRAFNDFTVTIFKNIVGAVDWVLKAFDKIAGWMNNAPQLLSKVSDFLAPGLQISANAAAASAVPASVMAGAARGNGQAGTTIEKIEINGAGDPRAVGDEVVRRTGLGESMQSITPGMLGPGAY